MSVPAAIVLCGGQGRRMGRPKAWLPFGPETLLERVVRLLGEVADPLVVVAAAGQPLPPLPPEVVVERDRVADQGPLHGLVTGLATLPRTVELAYITATDAPFLQPGWVGALGERIGTAGAAVPFVAGIEHPLAALYRRSVALDAGDRLLREGRRALRALVAALPTRRVLAEELLGVDPDLRTLRNLNTHEEYRQALRDAGYGPASD